MKDIILKDFDDSKMKFSDFKEKMELLISELLKSESIIVHQITGRVKERVSLEKKIERKDDKYKNISDITDIIGIRIITNLESDVDKVAEILNREFTLDPINSIDKRNLKSDQFGYRSLHYVVLCNNDRVKLVEYKRFQNLKFEIQVRSMLQHAWAEIEHDLGYKGINSIPDAYKRSFNRVAALLESADLEFDRLKKELIEYESNIGRLIQQHPENVEINSTSLKSFVFNNENIQYIDKQISLKTKIKLINRKTFDTILIDEMDIERLYLLGILKIEELEYQLILEKENIIKFAFEWVGVKNNGSFEKGIAVFYLCYVLVGKKNDLNFANHYYNKFINRSRFETENDGHRIIDTYQKIVSSSLN